MDRIAVLAYAAGIIDGEGCINIRRQKTVDKIYHCLSVEVSNSDRRMTDFMHVNFGGSIRTGKRQNCKPYHKWTVTSKAAECFLKLIRDYLVVKTDQADIALNFRVSFIKKTNEIVSGKMFAFREDCKVKLRQLKAMSYQWDK